MHESHSCCIVLKKSIFVSIGPGMLEKLRYRFEQQKSDEESIEDVYDGKLYRDFSGPGRFLSCASNISLLGNTDGVSLICSTGYGVWPVFWLLMNFCLCKG